MTPRRALCDAALAPQTTKTVTSTRAAESPPALLARILEAQRRDAPLVAWAVLVGALAGGVVRFGLLPTVYFST